MSKPRLILVGDGSELEPFTTRDEAIAEAQAAWMQARRLHLRIVAKASDASMLRLQNGGALPHEDRTSRDVSVYTLSGLAKELRQIEELADQAASVLEDASLRMRKR